MDLYSILNLTPDCSQDDIRKAYLKLAKKWHPDKNKSQDADSKFKEMSFAYEILNDIDKRSEYDNMNVEEKLDFNIVLSQVISKYKDNYIVKFFYPNHQDLINDLQTNSIKDISVRVIDILKESSFTDIMKFYIKKNIITNVKDDIMSESDFYTDTTEESKIISEDKGTVLNEISQYNYKDTDIIIDIFVNLEDVLSKKLKIIKIKVQIYDESITLKFYVPILKKYCIFKNYGDTIEVNGNTIRANIIFNINIIPEPNIVINNSDIHINKIISLNELLHGSTFYVNIFNKQYIINEFKPLNNKLTYEYNNGGLPTNYINDNCGNLIVNFMLVDQVN
jgi:hypothetical protein